MPKVYNKHHGDAPPNAVYIGRGSKWGNPFTHLPSTKAEHVVKDRETAVAKYTEYILAKPELIQQVRKELAGKDLVCFCKPRSCHGDILLSIANNYATTLRLPDDSE